MTIIKNEIEIHRIQCAKCGEFNAKHMRIEADVQLFGPDKVRYALLCGGCNKELNLVCNGNGCNWCEPVV